MLELVVIEDNVDLNELLVENLSEGAFHAHGFTKVSDYERSGLRGDIFLLDLNLPEEDGLSFARRLKARRPEVGIVVLSVRNGSDARTQTYLSGVDTFLQKPCDLPEVRAAIASAARRAQLYASHVPDSLTLSIGGMRLTSNLGQVGLSDDETRLIAALEHADNRQLAYADIIRMLDPSGQLTLPTLEVRIARLHRKVRPVIGDIKMLRSIRNFGYRLVVNLRLSD